METGNACDNFSKFLIFWNNFHPNRPYYILDKAWIVTISIVYSILLMALTTAFLI